MLAVPDESNEDDLIAAALTGSPSVRHAAFADLVRAHAPAMERYLRSRRLNDADIKDAIQETWLRAFQRLSIYEARGRGLEAWLFGILKNVVHETMRKQLQLAPDDDLLAVPDDYSLDGEVLDGIELHEFRVWIDSVSLDAPEAIRQSIEAQLAGLEPKEIMELYGWSRSKTDTTKLRAIEWLKARADVLKRE